MRNRLSPTRLRKRSPLLGMDALEDRVVPAAPFAEFIDPHPSAGNQFGATVVALSTGNVVVTSPLDDFAATDAGAVYLFNGTTGALISTLTGSHANDKVGINGVTALTNGNFVVVSIDWDNGTTVDAGAVTWGSGTTGVSGVVSAANSLVGSQTDDKVGNVHGGDTSLTVLTNGNYVVGSLRWDNGAVVDAGAVTWGNGTTGISGAVTVTNSLVGSQAFDLVGNSRVTALTNGNYVVRSFAWDNGTVVDAGAVTWANGSVGIRGPVTAINSLVGSTSGDQVGYTVGFSSIKALTNGNYVVISQTWHNGVVANAGAVTWGNGTTGISGVVTVANSLVGTQADSVGNGDVLELRNGNYLVRSPFWDNGTAVDAGAITWGNGKTGVAGVVTAANSLVGSHTGDVVGIDGVAILAKGNYVVNSSSWDNGAVTDAGAVTWGDDTIGVSGVVSATNSLVGSQTDDILGKFYSRSSITILTNGNYIVRSQSWSDGPVVDVGAVTWGSGTTGIRGTISSANSLIGSSTNDSVGNGNVTELTNGNYLVSSSFWDSGKAPGAGAITWGNGNTGVSGVVSAINSLVGSSTIDSVGLDVIKLTNGNYVVVSPQWNNGTAQRAGAFTWGNGTTGVTGVVSAANSLVGSSFNDGFVPDAPPFDFRAKSIASAVPLTNGNYIVTWPNWNNGTIVDVGAATWGDGTKGISGTVSAANSLIGTTQADFVGRRVVPLTNGNYVVESPQWNNSTVVDAGAVTWGNGATGIRGAVSITNSLVGSSGFDMVGNVESLPDGNYNVRSPFWDNGGVFDPGVLTFGDGTKGIAGIITSANSVIGSLKINASVLVGVPQFAAGSDVGGGTATLFNADKSVRFAITPFPGFTGGVRTATADFNNDGVADLIVGTGPGIATRVLVFDGKTQAVLFDVAPFEASFKGGVYVSAGDVNGDGIPDLAITPDEGGGPRADVYSGVIGFPKIASFFGIDDVNFRGGARSAIADMTGDGVADLIVVAGFGGGPRVAAFDGKSLSTGAPVKIFGDFFAFEQALRNGIFVTAGDINGDGFADLIAGGGPGGGPRVLALDGKSLLTNQYVNLANFFGGDVDSRGGIRVAVKDLDGDNRADLVVGSGSGAGSRVTGYLGKNIAASGTPPAQFDFDSISGFTGGVFVG